MHIYITGKSVLGRVRSCVGEQALRCEMVAPSYMCQPNHVSMCFVYTVIIHVAVWLQVCCTVSAPQRDLSYSIIHRLVSGTHSFHEIMYLYSIYLYLVSTTYCDPTIILHKRNTNIQELHVCTLPKLYTPTCYR